MTIGGSRSTDFSSPDIRRTSGEEEKKSRVNGEGLAEAPTDRRMRRRKFTTCAETFESYVRFKTFSFRFFSHLLPLLFDFQRPFFHPIHKHFIHQSPNFDGLFFAPGL